MYVQCILYSRVTYNITVDPYQTSKSQTYVMTILLVYSYSVSYCNILIRIKIFDISMIYLWLPLFANKIPDTSTCIDCLKSAKLRFK